MCEAVRLYVRIAGIDQPWSRALTMPPGRLTTPHSPVTQEKMSFTEPFLCVSIQAARL